MREIEFRGKVVHNDPMTNPDDGWVHGFYYQDIDKGEVKHYIISCPMIWRVIPETVGQFTGLKDMNGKEIYEGDILNVRFGAETTIPMLVCFINGSWCIHEDMNEEEFHSLYDYCYDATIIGNIHDNPELLKSTFNS